MILRDLKSIYTRNKRYLQFGKSYLTNEHYLEVSKAIEQEISKSPGRTEVINYLLSLRSGQTNYLEIGVRDPEDNFSHVQATHKYGVDPGVEFEQNPVEFKMTSDTFFEQLSSNVVLDPEIRFDVIFIDGLHLAEQVDRDIDHALQYIKEDGFVVLHDCNPVSEWHARERFTYLHTPARMDWNGTTWKAFLKWRSNPKVYSCCIDSDYGIGILSKTHQIGKATNLENPFFEYNTLERHKKEFLNLIDFATFKKTIESGPGL